jgi:hypothetical protein
MPTLTSILPASGPPGTVVTASGTGFDPGSQIGCPSLAPTTYVSSTQLSAAVPVDLLGPAGGSAAIAVFVVNPDGSTSSVLMFTVEFPATTLQSWTTIDAVCGMVPGFARGGAISDESITEWIEGTAQAIAAIMLKRNLPTNPTQWTQPGACGMPSAAGLLEMLNRLGAAADLASAVASLWGQSEWGVAATLRSKYDDEMLTLREGEYDKLFLPAAATLEPGPLFASGDTTDWRGFDERAFRKDQVF